MRWNSRDVDSVWLSIMPVLFDQKMNYIYFVCSCLLTPVCSPYLVTYSYFSRWDDNAWLRVDEWSADGNQSCRQVLNELGCKKKCDTWFIGWSYTIVMKSPFSQWFWKMKCSIKDDKHVWGYWKNMLAIQSTFAKVISWCISVGFLAAKWLTTLRQNSCWCVGAKDARISTFRFSHYRSQDLTCNSELLGGVVFSSRKKWLAKDERWKTSIS